MSGQTTDFKGKMNTLSSTITLLTILVCFPSEIWSFPKGKNLLLCKRIYSNSNKFASLLKKGPTLIGNNFERKEFASLKKKASILKHQYLPHPSPLLPLIRRIFKKESIYSPEKASTLMRNQLLPEKAFTVEVKNSDPEFPNYLWSKQAHDV